MFAENFNRICRARGTTPTALVLKMGLTSAKVTMWNNGSLPKQDTLLRLAKELECSVMDFFKDEDAPIFEESLNDDERDIIKVYRAMDRRTKHEFMAIVYQYETK